MRGILAVSFGTTHADTRVKTIEAIERDLGGGVYRCQGVSCMDKQNHHEKSPGEGGTCRR